MSKSASPIPEDYAQLRAFAASLQSKMEHEAKAHHLALQARDAELKSRNVKLQLYEQELYAKTLHIEKLKAQLALLRRARFGRSSEKLDHDIEQLELLIGDLEEGQAESDERTDAVKPAASASPQQGKLQPVR